MTTPSPAVAAVPPPARAFWSAGIGRFRRYHLLPLIVLAASLTVTFQLWRSSQQHALHEVQASFDFSVREAATRIEQRMAAYEQVLHSVEGFMSHANLMSREEFRHFVEKLRLDESFPGIQGVSFAQIVPAGQKEQHQATFRAEGFPDYAIHPAGERELYTPVIYIEPFSGRNLRAFGHDTYSQPARRAAMEQARDLDQPVMTGKVTLVQENDKDVQAGFLIYLPVFKYGVPHRSVEERRAAIVGWVSAPFRMNDLMDGLHGEQAANLDIEIFDGDTISAASLMYDPDHDHVDSKAAPGLFQTARRLKIANHAWTLKIRSLPAFDARLDRESARIVASSGIGISLLLTLLTLMLVNGRERALHAARVMNRELLERETRYRQMFEETNSIAYLLDPDSGRIVDANPAAAAFWGYPLEQLRQMHIAEINTSPRGQVMKVLRQVAEGKRTHIEWRHLLKNGEIRDVEVFSSALAYQGQVLLYSILHDISDRKHAEQALLESETRSREINATIGEGVFVTDRNGLITFSNPEAQRLLGWSETVLLGQDGHKLLHHSRADGTPYPVEECEINRVLISGQAFRSHDEVFWRKDGSMLPVSVSVTPIIHDQQVLGSVLAFHDIIERKKAERALADESTKNAMLLRTASDGLHVLDMKGNLLLASDAFCRMLGYTMDEIVGMNVSQWDAQWSAAELQEIVGRLVDQDQIFETRHRRRDGSQFEVEIHACGVVINGQRLLYAAARDITERKKAAERVHHLANYDLLTDLPNRALLNDRLQQALAKARRDSARMALMFLDLDKFKPVNDRLGHNVGDLLLKEVAVRMQCCVRESDTVARVGGDEFVVLLPSVEDEHASQMVAQKILATLEQPFVLAGHQIHISASIGIAIYPEHGEDEHLLIKSADQAMYQAKHGGGSALVSYSDLPPQTAESTPPAKPGNN
jgi:diguanylate cyclase (GGDEF)-like protein/PAS domain S-box-containing protein